MDLPQWYDDTVNLDTAKVHTVKSLHIEAGKGLDGERILRVAWLCQEGGQEYAHRIDLDVSEVVGQASTELRIAQRELRRMR